MFYTKISIIFFTISIMVSHTQIVNAVPEPQCLPILFLQETYSFNPDYSESRIRLHAEKWKDLIITDSLGGEIFEMLIPEKYYMMLHATLRLVGLEIYRVCEKGSNYLPYGRIAPVHHRGYRIKFDNLHSVNQFLKNNKFRLYDIYE